MTAPLLPAPHTLRGIQEMLGLSRSAVARLIAHGFVSPSRGPRNEYRFSFRDVVLLRTAHKLQLADIPTRKIVRALQRLKGTLPAELPPLFIGFFQDTTLVVIVGLLDFLDTIRSSMRDPQWQGIVVLEGYIFAASVYLFFSTIMGAYSRFLERHFRMGHD